MIELTTGNIFEAKTDAVVNPVNCVGVMGKGLALLFDKQFPGNSQAYKQACAARALAPGGLLAHPLSNGPWKFILNVATKNHWRQPSYMSDIQRALVRLRAFAQLHRLESLAVPALGCGNGGLQWASVLPCIESTLGDLETQVLVYPPK
jgi:O-acetyl-ADP-ribose deacetylase (regulator of RNase III)